MSYFYFISFPVKKSKFLFLSAYILSLPPTQPSLLLSVCRDLQTSVVNKWPAQSSDIQTSFICKSKIPPQVPVDIRLYPAVTYSALCKTVVFQIWHCSEMLHFTCKFGLRFEAIGQLCTLVDMEINHLSSTTHKAQTNNLLLTVIR